MYYTEPRYTKDLDVLVRPTPQNARRVLQALAAFGAPLSELTEEDLAAPGTIFQIGVEPNRVDILNRIEAVDFEDAWKNRRELRYGDVTVAVLGREELLPSSRRMTDDDHETDGQARYGVVTREA